MTQKIIIIKLLVHIITIFYKLGANFNRLNFITLLERELKSVLFL